MIATHQVAQHPPFRFGLVASSPPTSTTTQFSGSGRTSTSLASSSNHAGASEGLTRGAYPLPRNVRFLIRLRLRTILSLTPEVPAFHVAAHTGEDEIAPPRASEGEEAHAGSRAEDPVTGFVKANKIATIHIRVDKPTDDNEIPLSFKQASYILNIITNQTNLPLYIHCLNGGVVTGLVVALLRKLMCWSTKAAIAEYARFLAGEEIDGTGVHEFVERFSGEVEIPAVIPRWLWNGTIPYSRKHPTIRLKYPPQLAQRDDKAVPSQSGGERPHSAGTAALPPAARLTPRMSAAAAFGTFSSGRGSEASSSSYGSNAMGVVSDVGIGSLVSGKILLAERVNSSTDSEGSIRRSLVADVHSSGSAGSSVKKVGEGVATPKRGTGPSGSPATHGENTNVNAISATLNALDLEM
ncbi:tyrosine phosphatase family-domain-containing protein [Chytriomyces sp. MP71]|nr:tyrosine phosphatase family-domain-containing protein [Chytriomyces sp. MP71]